MKERENIIKKIFIGGLAGIGIGQVISLLFSLAVGRGEYYPLVPEFLNTIGSELKGIVVHILICGGLGIIFSSLEGIWDKKDWSLLKKSLVFYLFTLIPTLAAAYVLKWVNISLVGLLGFVLSFTVIFAIIWGISYLMVKKDIDELNKKVNN